MYKIYSARFKHLSPRQQKKYHSKTLNNVLKTFEGVNDLASKEMLHAIRKVYVGNPFYIAPYSYSVVCNTTPKDVEDGNLFVDVYFTQPQRELSCT